MNMHPESNARRIIEAAEAKGLKVFEVNGIAIVKLPNADRLWVHFSADSKGSKVQGYDPNSKIVRISQGQALTRIAAA